MSHGLGAGGTRVPLDTSAAQRRRRARNAQQRQRRYRRRRRALLATTVTVLLLVAGLIWYGINEILGPGVPDYTGTGDKDIIVEVQEGQTIAQIAQTLEQRNVVASARAFVLAAQDSDEIRSIQPGYYELRTRMSGEAAVSLILDPDSRVGQFEVRGGLQLDDVTQPDGSVVPGILSRIAEASCVQLNGHSTCVSVAQLRRAMANTPPRKLGVPQWALADVRAAAPTRRLEGLILPGTYNIRPGASAVTLLQQVMARSRQLLDQVGLPAIARSTPYGPYEILIIASIIQREAIESDFAKVSRVIYNRLAKGMPLQMDSTINYPREVQTLTTSDAERANPGPYNTYLNKGLTPTPIGSPSKEAIRAAVNPAEGDWLYFVKCRDDGSSCFSTTLEQHRKAVQRAHERGIF